MMVADVYEYIDRITRSAPDYEAQHAIEDAMHVDVLKAISHGSLDGDLPDELAHAALQSEDIDFPRYCA